MKHNDDTNDSATFPCKRGRTYFEEDDHVVSNDKGQWQARVVRIVSRTQMRVVWDINNAESLVNIHDFSLMFDLEEDRNNNTRPTRHRQKPNRFIEGNFHLQKYFNNNKSKPKKKKKQKRHEAQIKKQDDDEFLSGLNDRSINVSDLAIDPHFLESLSSSDDDDDDDDEYKRRRQRQRQDPSPFQTALNSVQQRRQQPWLPQNVQWRGKVVLRPPSIESDDNNKEQHRAGGDWRPPLKRHRNPNDDDDDDDESGMPRNMEMDSVSSSSSSSCSPYSSSSSSCSSSSSVGSGDMPVVDPKKVQHGSSLRRVLPKFRSTTTTNNIHADCAVPATTDDDLSEDDDDDNASLVTQDSGTAGNLTNVMEEAYKKLNRDNYNSNNNCCSSSSSSSNSDGILDDLLSVSSQTQH